MFFVRIIILFYRSIEDTTVTIHLQDEIHLHSTFTLKASSTKYTAHTVFEVNVHLNVKFLREEIDDDIRTHL
jgi:hypothetical protein